MIELTEELGGTKKICGPFRNADKSARVAAICMQIEKGGTGTYAVEITANDKDWVKVPLEIVESTTKIVSLVVSGSGMYWQKDVAPHSQFRAVQIDAGKANITLFVVAE